MSDNQELLYREGIIMIKVLIAEDEPPIARAISRMVEEANPAFTVIGYENNGKDALDHIRREPVDLVITDIRMPVMDGLKLLEVLRMEWPDCMVVILSGHQDFDYTQTALRLGAFDYLLKPLSRDKLGELLVRIEDAYSRMLMQQAVASWRAGSEPMKSNIILEKSTPHAIILALAGHWPAIPDDAFSPGSIFWQTNDPDVLAQNLMAQAFNVFTFVGRAAAERIFLLENITSDQASTLAKDLFNKITQTSALPKTLCVMPGPISFKDIGSSIRLMRGRLYMEIKLCRSALIWGQNKETYEDLTIKLSPDSLIEALCVRNEELIKSAVNAAIDTAVANGMTQLTFLRFIDAVIYDKRLSFQTKVIKDDIDEAIINTVSHTDLSEAFAQIFIQYTMGDSKVEQNSLIERIKQYLSAHYAEDISSEMLSAKFGFVPSYLSKVFRKQTGISPIEYLTKLRVEKAKSLMENHDGLLIRDVARLVGINDPYYFSKLFKKVTGSWPTQYQKNVLPKAITPKEPE